MANVILGVHLFASRKNDFYLGPYVSNADGIVVITKEDLYHDVEATYDSGLMDYVSVETCHTLVEIELKTADDIEKALHSREKVWTMLLKGETERWGTIKNLLKTYKTSANKNLDVSKEFSRIRDDWDGRRDEYEYDFFINPKA
jgi:hypothetical protein